MTKNPNNLALQYAAELKAADNARVSDQKLANDNDVPEFHVQTTGAGLTELYETIRNASKYEEENLQLTHAIERFLTPYFFKSIATANADIGADLITELTMTGYLANDSIKEPVVDKISKLANSYLQLANKIKDANRDQIARWIIKPLSVEIEHCLVHRYVEQAFINLAFNYFIDAINETSLREGATEELSDAYQASVYIAVQRALLGKEEAAVRQNLMERYQISTDKPADYVSFNQQIDQAINSKITHRLTKLISRHGAVWRIIYRTSQNDDSLYNHINDEKSFLGSFNATIEDSYDKIRHKINRGVIRSIIFIVITKFIIGIAIEVPYDIWINGAVLLLPLVVNLALPPIYMALLRLTLTMPDKLNTKALHREASRILYRAPSDRPILRWQRKQFSKTYTILYWLVVLGVFGGISWLLVTLAKFEWVHIIIFFVFISTASFLGFRLSRLVRKIEVGAESQSLILVLRDFIYMPFVSVGQKINETYTKINLVSRLLDILVEMPLKTILGQLRRWGSFMSARRDDL